jgi:DNA-directed RNA polymerase subunit F
LEYTKKFSKLNLTNAGKLADELLQIEKLNKAHAVALVDLMPKNADEVRLIFAKERFVLEDGDINKVLEAVNKYRK